MAEDSRKKTKEKYVAVGSRDGGSKRKFGKSTPYRSASRSSDPPAKTKSAGEQRAELSKRLLIQADIGKRLLTTMQPLTDEFLERKPRAHLINLATCLLHFQVRTSVHQALAEHLPSTKGLDSRNVRRNGFFNNLFRMVANADAPLINGDNEVFADTMARLLAFAGYSTPAKIELAVTLLRNEDVRVLDGAIAKLKDVSIRGSANKKWKSKATSRRKKI